jgi:hypothetical protein
MKLLPVVAIKRALSVIVYCLLFLGTGLTQNLALTAARAHYRNACESPQTERIVLDFIASTEALKSTSADPVLIKAMNATANMMLAESMVNPFSKLQQFTEWKAPLESAIAEKPDHPELRLLRLSIQWTVPFFLDYSSEMEEDAERVRQAWSDGYWSDDPEHAAFVLTFLQHVRDDHSK